jgi:GxxExxY protein
MEREDEKKRRFEDGTDEVIGGLIEVHRALGPGLLESTYEACVARELALRGLSVERQAPIPVVYKGAVVDLEYRADLVVEGRILVELKAVERLMPIHQAQVFTYLRLTGLPVALLVNFNVRVLRDGLKRLWLNPSRFSPSPLLVNPPSDGSDGC